MEAQFKKYQDLKNKELNSNPTDITIQLMQQLPTIFVSGAKKCGTKTLMRFFGHHPQIIRGLQEAPFRTTGDIKKDMEYYLTHLWTLWTVNGPYIDNKRKIMELRKAKKEFYFMAKTANSGINKIVDFINDFPNFIDDDYIKDWRHKVKNIFIVCDPVNRLLSDFKHVTSEWHVKKKKINRKFLGPESNVYPFQKLTFDMMVDNYLPKLKDGNMFGDTPEIAEMFSVGFYGQPQKFFLGEERVIERENGLVLDGAKLKTAPWIVFKELEKRFGLEPYFNESLFEKRKDGYYCVRIFNHSEPLDCMPETKGRTKLSANQTSMSLASV